jgi:hypothetical protein
VTTPDPFHIPEELRAYFRAIEESVSRERGQPLILSPQDFHRVFAWWDAQVPLEAVLAGLADFFARKKKRPGRKVYTLAYADDEVMRALGELRRRALGAALGVPVDEAAQTRTQLNALARRLRETRAAPPSLNNLCTEIAAQLESLAAEAPPPSITAVAKTLAKRDRELLAVAGSLLGEAERKKLHHEVTAQLAELAIAPDDEAMRELLHARHVRERFGLPRLGLYG